MVVPPAAIEAIQPHRPAGIRGVDEAPFADIDADVADLTAIPEEHQVAT